jgi:hypothetical protein
MGGGRWAMGGGRWAMGDGRWEVSLPVKVAAGTSYGLRYDTLVWTVSRRLFKSSGRRERRERRESIGMSTGELGPGAWRMSRAGFTGGVKQRA